MQYGLHSVLIEGWGLGHDAHKPEIAKLHKHTHTHTHFPDQKMLGFQQLHLGGTINLQNLRMIELNRWPIPTHLEDGRHFH